MLLSENPPSLGHQGHQGHQEVMVVIISLSHKVIISLPASLDCGMSVHRYYMHGRWSRHVDQTDINMVWLSQHVQLTSFLCCEAQGKGRARGGPRKVTQRSFIGGGWLMVDIKARIEASISPWPKPNLKLRQIRHPQFVANLWRSCLGRRSESPTIHFYRGWPKSSFTFRQRRWKNAINCILKLIAWWVTYSYLKNLWNNSGLVVFFTIIRQVRHGLFYYRVNLNSRKVRAW